MYMRECRHKEAGLTLYTQVCIYLGDQGKFQLTYQIFHVQLENNYKQTLNSRLTAGTVYLFNQFNSKRIGPDPGCVYESGRMSALN